MKKIKTFSSLAIAICTLPACNISAEQTPTLSEVFLKADTLQNPSQQVIQNTSLQNDFGYEKIDGGKYKLTRDLTFTTRRFGQITLTEGYESDGSSSPIPDTHETRIAGFLHDSLYSASGHLRFERTDITGWTKQQADDEYCELMSQLNVATYHQTANCIGVKTLKGIETAWDKLSEKRKKRWASYQNQT